jgi:hypothetical protein
MSRITFVTSRFQTAHERANFFHFFLDTLFQELYTFVNCGKVMLQNTNRENRQYGNEKGSQETSEEGSKESCKEEVAAKQGNT